MKRVIIIAFFLSIMHIVYAQTTFNSFHEIETRKELLRELRNSPNLDSLKELATSENNNRKRAIALFAVTVQYLNINLDSSLKYIRLFNAGPSKPTLWEANGDVIMGDIYLRLGNASMAIETILKGKKMLEELKDSSGIGMAYWNLGKVYQSIDDSKEAITSYLYAIKVASAAHEKVPLTFSLGQLGQLYMQLGLLDSALYYTQSANKIRIEDLKNYSLILSVQLGNIYQKKGYKILAMQHYRSAIEKAFPANNFVAASGACLGLAALYQKENKQDSCYHYAKTAFDLAEQLNNSNLILQASKFLKEFFKQKDLLDSAFKYQEIMIAANDSLHNIEKINQVHAISFAEQQRKQEAETQKREFQSKIRQFVLIGSLIVFLIIAVLLYRNNRHKQKANTLLLRQKQETENQKQKVEITLQELKSTQAQLVQSEKMASLGELTAGIAHEIQNPLNFVNNFSDVNQELLQELKEEADKGNMEEVKSIANDVMENEQKINHHGKRADAIVKGMLQHSRKSSGKKEPTDINALADEYLRLSYHGLRAKDKNFNATIETDFDNSIGKINIIPEDIGRVFLNLFNNAFYAVNEQKSLNPVSYQPTVFVRTQKCDNEIQITVRDNGNGIPQKIVDKIFQPFFTTKPTGQGTGLGLSLSYDIIKAHCGEIKVESKEGEGTEFIIQLPI
jgi:signal transduction histidine kinase